MGIKFIGEAIQEFQEQNLVPFTELKGFAWLQSLGLNPTIEALSAQALVILFCTCHVLDRSAQRPADPRGQGEGRDPGGEDLSFLKSHFALYTA